MAFLSSSPGPSFGPTSLGVPGRPCPRPSPLSRSTLFGRGAAEDDDEAGSDDRRSSSPTGWNDGAAAALPAATTNGATVRPAGGQSKAKLPFLDLGSEGELGANEGDGDESGELSPGFDASFASSMSIGTPAPPHLPGLTAYSPTSRPLFPPHFLGDGADHLSPSPSSSHLLPPRPSQDRPPRSSSSPYRMDISPVPPSRTSATVFGTFSNGMNDPAPLASGSGSSPGLLPNPFAGADSPDGDGDRRMAKSSDPFAKAFAHQAHHEAGGSGRKTIGIKRGNSVGGASASTTATNSRPPSGSSLFSFADVGAVPPFLERTASAPQPAATARSAVPAQVRKTSDPTHLQRPGAHPLIGTNANRSSSLACPSRISSYTSLATSSSSLTGPSPVEEEADPILAMASRAPNVKTPLSDSDVSMMDVDSPGFAQRAAPGLAPAPPIFAPSGPVSVRAGRSASTVSVGSIGKRTRLEFDLEHGDGASAVAQDERLGAFFSSSPNFQGTLRQPSGSAAAANGPLRPASFESSSPGGPQGMSPTAAASSKLTVGRRAGERTLTGFLFPNSKDRSLGKASGASATGPKRPGLGPVQSSASLFGAKAATGRPRDAAGRATMKSRRAISCAGTEGNLLFAAPHVNDENAPPPPALPPHPVNKAKTWPKVAGGAMMLGHVRGVSEQIVTMGTEEDADADSPVRRRTMPPAPKRPVSASEVPVSRPVTILESPVGMGFSEKERAGKILPCHKVSSDGLMRISCETLDDLLEGRYDDRITQRIVIDCRFAYEFSGGHIKGAVNISEKEATESLFLHGALWGSKTAVPLVSESGRPDQAGQWKKTVIVFHCEFSAKRAPTTAKFLREHDRHMNMAHYPALHFPEIYILEGGYAKYQQVSPQHCEGRYVQMDDPKHRHNRHADLNQFRQREGKAFARAQSFTFGESRTQGGLFADKSNVARGGQGRSRPTAMIDEEDAGDSSVEGAAGDSPCPPVKPRTVRGFAPPKSGGALARRGLSRNQTVAVLEFGGPISSMR